MTMVLPMAGVDAMDGIPEIGQRLQHGEHGGLMLLGLLMWYFMLPDGDSDIGSGATNGWQQQCPWDLVLL